jgi:chorismate synthase
MISSFETPRGVIELRELNTMDDMEAAEQIQMKVWGPDISPHPKEMLIPVQHEGGLLAGAFNAEQMMVGLIFSFPTHDPSIHHSQMLATLEDWRGLNIGTRLKWFQRDWCLNHGINLVRWTVDPLRTANAELNIRHLGGICSTYYLNYYGIMKGIDAGTPTDRLLLEWYLNSARVEARYQNMPGDQGFPSAEAVNDVKDGEPIASRLDVMAAQILIRLPRNYIETSHTQPELALRWRLHTRDLFTHYFKRGYAIKEFTRISGPAYLLEKGSSNGNDTRYPGG